MKRNYIVFTVPKTEAAKKCHRIDCKKNETIKKNTVFKDIITREWIFFFNVSFFLYRQYHTVLKSDNVSVFCNNMSRDPIILMIQ